MGKNKKRNTSEKPIDRKHHVPTAFELAFLKAEARKKKESQQYSLDGHFRTGETELNQKKTLKQHYQPARNPLTPRPNPMYAKKINPPDKLGCTSKNIGLKRIADSKLVLKELALKKQEQQRDISKNLPVSSYFGKIQVHNGNYTDESDIVIGFDFGTSSSKIVIRDSGRQTAYAVPFGPLACSGNTYIIPTQVYVSNDGFFSLTSEKFSCNELKIFLMEDPDKPVYSIQTQIEAVTASELVAAYMALVIQTARTWFLEKNNIIYLNTNIYWQLNLGIPSENYDNRQQEKAFQIVAMAAWRLSRLTTPINISHAKQIMVEAKALIEDPNNMPIDSESLWLHPDFVNTHPEVIMEVVGYVRSPSRTDGLHLLVDVGASTLDAAMFIINKRDGEDIFPILESRVTKMGTMALHRFRIQSLKSYLEESLEKINLIDPLTPLPDTSHYDIVTDKDRMCQSDHDFFHSCSKMIGEVLRSTYNTRDPHSDAWLKGLPVFLCGGGGKMPQYKDMLKYRGIQIADHLSDFSEFNLKTIPQPDQLEAPDLPPNEYDRLAVAYGLSFTTDEIGKVIPERDIIDIQKTKRDNNIENLYVSKDMC